MGALQEVTSNESLYKVAIGALVSVIVFLTGLCVKLAKFAWDERGFRAKDALDFRSEAQVSRTVAKQKGEGSPK